MLPDVTVHVMDVVSAAYLQVERSRIVQHQVLAREPFLELLRSMHATANVSLAECYPMTVLESFLSGVACVTSNTSAIFDDAPFAHRIIVDQHDSPLAIARKLDTVLEARAELVPVVQDYLETLNRRAESQWAEFISV
jgi:hypothetical protein